MALTEVLFARIEDALVDFTDLADAPSTYSGSGGFSVKVKATEDGLEFIDGAGGAFVDLSDVPNSYSGAGSKLVRVNAGASALEFVDGSSLYQALDSDLTSWAAVTRASGFDTFAATPSSSNLKSLVTDETGSGALVFANTPTLVTPVLGTPTSGTLTNCTGLPIAGLSTSTTTAIGVGSVELGHASDTTLTRDSAGVLAVEGVALATNIPQNSQSTAYTLVLSDAQKHILHPSSDNNARTFTIPANSSVAYPVGTAITFVNKINTVTIAITTDTLTFAGAGTTGSRTLAANGIATALKIASTEWMISGTGLS